MNASTQPFVDPLAVDQEPTDEQLAEVMADVLRVVHEKRAMGDARMRAMMAVDLLDAQIRMEYLRKQFNLPRR